MIVLVVLYLITMDSCLCSPLTSAESASIPSFDINQSKNEHPVACKPAKGYRCGLPEILSDAMLVPLNPGIIGTAHKVDNKNSAVI